MIGESIEGAGAAELARSGAVGLKTRLKGLQVEAARGRLLAGQRIEMEIQDTCRTLSNRRDKSPR